jgi:carbon monoxide dehydrogenase subunit G
MQIEQSFAVRADPDVVYAFLLDVSRIAVCVPGVSSVEEREPDTFVGTMKVKVGPVGMTYRGTATLLSREPAERRATGSAEGTEGLGASRVKASGTMVVTPIDEGSLVTISADLAIAGRLAQFGRGIIDAVAKRIVAKTAECISHQLEQDQLEQDQPE